MRKNEAGEDCPSTLGEYLTLCESICGSYGVPNNRALQFLRDKIAEQGADQPVVASDSQMRMILMPMMWEDLFPNSLDIEDPLI
jgi:hypothetical protein